MTIHKFEMPSITSSLLPISVVIPTRDSMDKLPQHLAHHAALFARCAQIIHCDSHSKDGTKTHVASALAHPGLQQVDHPPGLYQSWNFAIQQCTQPYLYISTVGDELDPDGLQKLLDLALKTKADVVLSPPRFIEESGQINNELVWPINHLIRNHNLNEPGIIPNHLVYAEAVLHAPDGILGSSASCLYRTEFLKPRPFPLGYHGASDSVWALRHLPFARCALIPTPVSTFLLHQKSYDSHEILNLQIAILVRRTISRELQMLIREIKNHSPSPVSIPRPLLDRLRDFNLIALLRARQEKNLVITRKTTHGLWVLSPQAWTARKYRNLYRKLIPDFHIRARDELSQAKG